MVPLRVRNAIQALKNSGYKGPIKFSKTCIESSAENELNHHKKENSIIKKPIYRIYNPETNETLSTLKRQMPLKNEIVIKEAMKSKLFASHFHQKPMISTQLGGRMITSSVEEKMNIRSLERGNISITSSPKAALFKKQNTLFNLLYRSYKPTGLPCSDMVERIGDSMTHHIHWLPSDAHAFRGSASYQESLKSPKSIVLPRKEAKIMKYTKNLQNLIKELS